MHSNEKKYHVSDHGLFVYHENIYLKQKRVEIQYADMHMVRIVSSVYHKICLHIDTFSDMD